MKWTRLLPRQMSKMIDLMVLIWSVIDFHVVVKTRQRLSIVMVFKKEHI